jgi:hypothetical protein
MGKKPAKKASSPDQEERAAAQRRADDIAAEREFDAAAKELEERQVLADSGRDVLRRRLQEHTFDSPELSGGDVDADWDASLEGTESVGGHVVTPDQDQVDEIGAAAGLTYADDEPLDYGKVSERDRRRWELNPASAADPMEDGGALDEDDDEDLGHLEVEAVLELDGEDAIAPGDLDEEEDEDDDAL